jgi:hypothetical protein
MGLFGKILDKLGFNKAEAASAPASTTAAGGQGGAALNPTPGLTPPPAPANPVPADNQGSAAASASPAGASSVPPQAQPQVQPQGQGQQPQAMSMVDVVAELEQRAAASPQKLNWRTSIVDLLKLLDMDSSLEARKELAVELDCPQELMADSAKMNVWLHKTVLTRIAANGGNVPADLLN